MYPKIASHKTSTLKTGSMFESKLKQLQYESETWKRLLCFMQEENVYQKNRLSEILKDEINKNILDEVEAFYSSFLFEDEYIISLRNEIDKVTKELQKDFFVKGEIKKSLEMQLKQLRNNIKDAEKRFSQIKIAFNSYLSGNI